MRHCAVVLCHHAQTWTWQPAGPSAERLCFVGPGAHARGFAAIPVCDTCKHALEGGISLVLVYQDHSYMYTPSEGIAVLD
jgi:hypothetical protein